MRKRAEQSARDKAQNQRIKEEKAKLDLEKVSLVASEDLHY